MSEENLKNPFAGYFDNLKKHKEAVNPVHEVVNVYYKMRGWADKPKSFYQKRERSYGKLASEAKKLLEACEGSLDDAVWALDRMKYLAEKGGFEWSIITCLKHKL